MPKRPPTIVATTLLAIRQQINEALRELSDYVEELYGIDGKQFRVQNNIDLNGFRIVNSGEPQSDSDLATKGYVDENVDSSVTGPPFSIDNGVARFDGGAGNLLQNSLATIDDAGSVNIPTGQTYKIGGAPHSHAFGELSDVDFTGEAWGDLVFRGEEEWNNLPPDDEGKVLTTHGANAAPTWEDAVAPSDSVEDETTWGITPDAGTAETYSRSDHTHGTPAEPAAGPSPSDSVESETTWGISAAAGSSDDYSRADHTHGTPVEPEGSIDGWLADSDTLVYVSATSFKIEGKNVTTRYPVGTKLKITQTTVKYFYVIAGTFSTDSVFTVTGGSDYSIANATIASPYYSYQSCPQGFPHWFCHTPTWTGFSSDPSTTEPDGISRFKIEGRLLTWYLRPTVGTSNSTSFSVTGPVNAVNRSGYTSLGTLWGYDNNNMLADVSCYYINTNSNSVVFRKTIASVDASWTASNGKATFGYMQWEI